MRGSSASERSGRPGARDGKAAPRRSSRHELPDPRAAAASPTAWSWGPRGRPERPWRRRTGRWRVALRSRGCCSRNDRNSAGCTPPHPGRARGDACGAGRAGVVGWGGPEVTRYRGPFERSRSSSHAAVARSALPVARLRANLCGPEHLLPSVHVAEEDPRATHSRRARPVLHDHRV